MGRTKHYKAFREPRRDSYSTYVEYYKELVAKSPGMFRPMYTEAEFKERYDYVKVMFKSRIAQKIAECQRYMPYFIQRYFGLTSVANEEEAMSYIQKYLEISGDLDE